MGPRTGLRALEKSNFLFSAENRTPDHTAQSRVTMCWNECIWKRPVLFRTPDTTLVVELCAAVHMLSCRFTSLYNILTHKRIIMSEKPLFYKTLQCEF